MTDVPPPKKIYDCFIFYNELDLLEIRLNELYDVVDYFVICEANVTFKGRPKLLVFAENRERFAAFADKIIHIVVDDMPVSETPWDREEHQRNALRRGLVDLKPDDIVIVSDADEIIRSSAIEYLRKNEGYFLLEMDMYQFYLNMFANSWFKPFAYSWSLDSLLGPYYDVREREARTLEQFSDRSHRIEHAAWHFTFVGGPDTIRNKLNAYSHSGQWYDQMLPPDAAERQLSRLRNVGGSHILKFHPIDETFPKYVRDNLPRFIAAGWVKDLSDRLRELEEEVADFIDINRRSVERQRYKDVELERAITTGFGSNLALGKPAAQSSISPWSYSQTPGEEAQNATNGTIAEPGAFAFHTDYEENPWWHVDLGAEFIVNEVVIYNRREHPERLRHFSLLKSLDGENWEVFFQKTGDSVFDADPCVIGFTPGVQTRFLRVRLDGRDYLHFVQCLVYGYAAVPIQRIFIRDQPIT